MVEYTPSELKLKETRHRYYLAHKQEFVERAKRWAEAHPEIAKESKRRYQRRIRAKKRAERLNAS